MLVKCLSCDMENDALATAGYCESCGKKLPTSAMVRTRRAIAAEGDGEEPPADRKMHSATTEALFTAAVVQLVSGGLFLVIGPALLSRVPETFLALAFGWTLGPAVWFGGLALLVRWQSRWVTWLAVVSYLIWIALGFIWQLEFARGWLVVHGAVGIALAWVMWVGLRSPKGDRSWR
jgi:hypothetical protein